jgi:hypothetical protein
VEVSLIDGKVEVTPKEDGQIDPRQLLKAVYDSGVSVAEMDVTLRGKVVKDASGALTLNVTPNQSFSIEPGDVSKELESVAGQPTPVTVRGQLFKKPAGKKKQKPDPSAMLKLLILEVQKKE